MADDFVLTTNGDNTITIAGYSGLGGDVNIPDVTNGCLIVSIGNSSFRYCSNLTSIVIGGNVTSIGYMAFDSCCSLTSITISASVATIGPGAFRYCGSLKSVILPDKVTVVDSSTFEICKSLTNVCIGTNVVGIGPAAFANCINLRSVRIPDSVAVVAMSAFGNCTGLTNLYIGTNVVDIGSSAFANCINLRSVRIPDNVTAVAPNTFENCTGLTNLYIGTNVGVIYRDAFKNCVNLRDVRFPDSVTSIGERAFDGCSSLTNMMIGSNVNSIVGGVFSGCNRLGAITVDVLNSAYSSVEGVLFNKSQTELIQFPGGRSGCYTIPITVTNIVPGSFAYCGLLSKVNIGTNVVNIGSCAFLGCANLNAIELDELNSGYSSIDGVLFNKSRTVLIQFPGGKGGEYMMPNTVVSIGGAAFEACSALTNIVIGTNVTSIGSYAFMDGTGLTNVTIPSSVTNIGYGALSCINLRTISVDASNAVYSSRDGVLFDKNQSTLINFPRGRDGCYTILCDTTNIACFAFDFSILDKVIIPENVNFTVIRMNAFRYCSNLTSVVIGGGGAILDMWAFQQCPNLAGVYFKGNPIGAHSDAFVGDTIAVIYYLPGTTGWGSMFGGRPTALWQPQIQKDDGLWVRSNQFGFNFAWASGMVCVVEASTNLINPLWITLQSNTLTTDSSSFNDSEWTNYPGRYYRVRWPQ